uniref:Uncharacterized protein n=1 Tax=Leersia perrieri TaxID=77586 RepID=A0A0D9X642_9ORYZ
MLPFFGGSNSKQSRHAQSLEADFGHSLDHGNATKQQNQGHGQTNQVVTPIPDEGSGAGILLFHGLIVIVRMARMKTMCMLEDTNSLDMP